MADFEDSAEQAHFSAFTARVRTIASYHGSCRILTRLSQVARDPEQVLRYCFDGELAPLWPSRFPVPAAGDVPPCCRCGAER